MTENADFEGEEDYVRVCFDLFDQFGDNFPCQKRPLSLTFENLFKKRELEFCKKLRFNQINTSAEIAHPNIIKVHVYAGGESGNMIGPFMTAMANTSLQKNGIVRVEYKYKKVRSIIASISLN